jgi:hypothetical protein
MEKFSYKCWGKKEPYTHHAGSSPIDRACRSPEIEIVNLCMLTFAESPGDHRSLCFDISPCSLLVDFKHKICCPVSRWLITSQHSSVKQYNEIVCQQFEMHHIVERMEAMDKMKQYCRYSAPEWL